MFCSEPISVAPQPQFAFTSERTQYTFSGILMGTLAVEVSAACTFLQEHRCDITLMTFSSKESHVASIHLSFTQDVETQRASPERNTVQGPATSAQFLEMIG